ncbi:MAG TPA: hypothetical protein VHF22_11650 [Planctomycetota bacterium]|nr:hypothetical protein [Planctomycetota bacterium]
MAVPGSAGAASIEDALDFLLEAFIQPEGAKLPAPCHLVIGLPGAGKTTYLAMLGEMLLHRSERYHFADREGRPFVDLDVRRLDLDGALDAIRRRAGPAGVKWSARSLAPRVRDLVFDFARKVYAGYIARQQWAPATRRDESYFLVSELTKERRALARIVTLEASGEEYREMLRALGSRAPTPAKPSLRCLKRLLDIAEGLIILVDPMYERNDELYHTLFLALKEDLEPRARNALKKAVRDRLAKADGAAPEAHRIERERDFQRRVDAYQKRLQEVRAAQEARLIGLQKVLAAEDAMTRLNDEEVAALQHVEQLLLQIRPEEIEAGRARLEKHAQEKGGDGPVRDFYGAMTKFALSQAVLAAMAEATIGPPPVRPTEAGIEAVTATTDDVLRSVGIQAGFIRLTREELEEQEPERRFVKLRNVAIVVTKTDLYPVIHPPELFPRQRLPVTYQHLRMVDAYLRLCGGAIQYYNASATGYATFQDGMFLPGKEMSLTPINVIEPLFSMLGLEGG